MNDVWSLVQLHAASTADPAISDWVPNRRMLLTAAVAAWVEAVLEDSSKETVLTGSFRTR